MASPLHNNIFFDDFHRYVLQDVNVFVVPPPDPRKKPFRIDAVTKAEKGIAKDKYAKKPKENTQDDENKDTL